VCILIEVAVSTVDDALTANRAGAHRLELSTALELGGLTPSLATLRAVKRSTPLPVIALIRPRPAGFTYSETDFHTILDDATLALEHGADGIAFGLLHSDRTIDAARTKQLLRLTTHRQSVFHRAFDLTPDPFAALETLIDLGVTRILTSGQQPAAPQGAALIAQLIDRAAGRIEILPASGIRPENAAALIAQTGATQLHGTFSEPCADPASPICSDLYRRTSAAQIRATRQVAWASRP
jgi:copper homeostasis protein